MAKLKLWTAHLERNGVPQRMQFQAADKADAKDFAEREAQREAEWVASHDAEGQPLTVTDDAEFRKRVREVAFKVVKVEQS